MLARVMFCETESGKGRSGRDARTHGLERDAPATETPEPTDWSGTLQPHSEGVSQMVMHGSILLHQHTHLTATLGLEIGFRQATAFRYRSMVAARVTESTSLSMSDAVL